MRSECLGNRPPPAHASAHPATHPGEIRAAQLIRPAGSHSRACKPGHVHCCPVELIRSPSQHLIAWTRGNKSAGDIFVSSWGTATTSFSVVTLALVARVHLKGEAGCQLDLEIPLPLLPPRYIHLDITHEGDFQCNVTNRHRGASTPTTSSAARRDCRAASCYPACARLPPPQC